MIPNAEMEVLHAEAGTAVNLALSGEPEDGLVVLLSGRDRALDLAESLPWRHELLTCYDRAVASYCARYRVALPRSEPAAVEHCLGVRG